MNAIRKQLANIITCIRIICALILIFCPTFSLSFYIVYIIGGISDILDGIVARYFGKETKIGSRLDTIADITFIVIVLIKILNAVYVPLWLIIWIICIAVIKCINIISGFVISGHFVSEHTVLNKITGILLFAIPLYVDLLPKQTVEVLIIMTAVIATAAAVQEGYHIQRGKEIS